MWAAVRVRSPLNSFVGSDRLRLRRSTLQRASSRRPASGSPRWTYGEGQAEQLPFDDDSFDVVLAQLVVHFMTDPVAGLAEMGRVARPGGVVGACVWDHSADAGPLSLFWRAVHDLDPEARGEAGLAGVAQGHLLDLYRAAGLGDGEESRLTVTLAFRTFDDWWDPFTLGVGPAGAYVAGLGPDAAAALRNRCAELLPPAPFEVSASAWCVLAHR